MCSPLIELTDCTRGLLWVVCDVANWSECSLCAVLRLTMNWTTVNIRAISILLLHWIRYTHSLQVHTQKVPCGHGRKKWNVIEIDYHLVRFVYRPSVRFIWFDVVCSASVENCNWVKMHMARWTFNAVKIHFPRDTREKLAFMRKFPAKIARLKHNSVDFFSQAWLN